MNAQTISIALVVIIVIGGGFWYINSQSTKSDDGAMMDGSSYDDTMMEGESAMNDDSMVGGDAMMEGETEMMEGDGEVMESEAGSYEAYSAEKLALAESGDVLLFFHADWCPVCRAVEAEITSAGKLPAGVHILKVDYDKEIALRQKYGVTVQHTFVQVNAEGELIQKFNNASGLADVLSRVK